MSTREYLTRHGIRPSTQRVAVMDFLFDNCIHPTVEQIYESLLPGMPTLSKTTVYNTLKILESRGAIRVLDIDPVCERFDADTSLHAHSYCRVCGKVSDVMLSDKGFADRNAPKGMTVESAHLSYKGVCADCTAREKVAVS